MDGEIEINLDGKALLFGAFSGIMATSWSIAPLILSGNAVTLFTKNQLPFIFLGLMGVLATIFYNSDLKESGLEIPKVSVYSAGAGFIILSVLGYSALPLATAIQSGGNQGNISGDNLHVATLSVEGMVCTGCKYTVKNYLESMDGTKLVEVSLSQKEARVIYDADKISSRKIVNSAVFKGAYSAKLKKKTEYASN